MLKHTLTIAIRNLGRDRGYSLINIIGLSVALACCILMFLFVRHEWTYDTFHANASKIYRILGVTTEYSGERVVWATTPQPLGTTLIDQIPDVTSAVRLRVWSGMVRHGDHAFREDLILQTEPAFFEMFSFPLVQGDIGTALSDIHSVVLSRAMAEKYFGDADPIGEQIAIRDTEFTVTGVTEQIPSNSSIQFDFLIPFQTTLSRTDWLSGSVNTYIELGDASKIPALEQLFKTVVEQHIPPWGVFTSRQFRLQPLMEMHATTGIRFDGVSVRDPMMPYILSGIALMVLIIACINFMNLGLGRSATRLKEVGLRKVLGARRLQLMRQFWGETVFLCVLALVVGLTLAHLFLPVFNSLAETSLELDYASNWSTVLALIGLLAFVSLVAGSYPAMVLSGFQPVTMFRNRQLRFGGAGLFGRGLVVVQFGLSVLPVIGTFVMFQQLSYIRTRDLGFDREQVVVIRTQGANPINRLRDALASYPDIIRISGGATSIGPDRGVRMQGITGADGRSISVIDYPVAHEYLETLGIELLQGRGFSNTFGQDETGSVLVNEALVREMGWDEPVGQTLPGGALTVIGVVRDYHFQSLHHTIAPMTITLNPDRINFLLVKISPDNIPETVALLKDTWAGLVPDLPFEFYFLDEDIDRFYRAEQRFSRIATYASLFAIGIACLGVFGLTTLAVACRTKEIGIRRVLGAGVAHIVGLFSREYVLLLCVANVIAWLAAYYAMQRWLMDFAYRIDLGLTPFILGGVLTVTIALATAGYHAVRAAMANPVETLRYE